MRRQNVQQQQSTKQPTIRSTRRGNEGAFAREVAGTRQKPLNNFRWAGICVPFYLESKHHPLSCGAGSKLSWRAILYPYVTKPTTRPHFRIPNDNDTTGTCIIISHDVCVIHSFIVPVPCVCVFAYCHSYCHVLYSFLRSGFHLELYIMKYMSTVHRKPRRW
jgi:hypothetical protein